jgi:hypothetical protein
MGEFVITVETGEPAMPGLGHDLEAEGQFLQNHRNLSLDARDDGSVVATVHLQADDASEAEEEARRLVEEAMRASRRTVLPENISSTVTSRGRDLAG